MNTALVWMLTWTVLGSGAPAGGEQAKFRTREDCQTALAQKQEEYLKQGRRVAGTCVLTDRRSGV